MSRHLGDSWPRTTSANRVLTRNEISCQGGGDQLQVAKLDRNQTASKIQRLYAGQSWQKVAINLVEPIPDTSQRNRWILVDYFTQ